MSLLRVARLGPSLARVAPAIARPAGVMSLRHFHQSPQLREQQKESFLESKTGKTGTLILGAGLTAVAFSKELLILHNESVVAGCFFAAIFTLYRLIGGSVDEMLSDRSKTILEQLSKGKEQRIVNIEGTIADEQKTRDLVPTVELIHDVHQAIADMEIEVAHREMKYNAMHLIKSRLDTIVQLESKIRAAEQEQLVASLEKSVNAYFSGQKEDPVLKDCIDALGKVAI